MSRSPITVDEKGLTLESVRGDSFDVFCDDQHVWSFSPPPATGSSGAVFVRWPAQMRRFLDGVARFRIEGGGKVLYDEETRLGSGDGRIAFVDKAGIPIMIDKWGLIQRPFTGRGSGVVERMVEVTDQIIRILAEECDVHAWIAFGTLLGAARSGKVIGHDSDIDLAYVSDQPTPAAMAVEMFEMTRALRRHGLTVLPKSGSFITVLFPAPDGATASIDIYTCFYVGDLLHETATVRAPVPRSAIDPLTTMEFEGARLQAPADADALLVASYGPGWRVPDPSFKHQPGPEIVTRFDGWFGSLMRNRRDWERALRTRREAEGLTRSDFARWVAARLAPGVPVLEVGCGLGADALHLANKGWHVHGIDYGRGISNRARRRAQRKGLPATFAQVNLYDLRDVLTEGARLARGTTGPRALVARRVLGSLDEDGVENFWRLAGLLLRGGGTAYLEIEGAKRPGSRPDALIARRYPLTPEDVVDQARSAGATEVDVHDVEENGPRPVWRLTAGWPENRKGTP